MSGPAAPAHFRHIPPNIILKRTVTETIEYIDSL
jgi:hypothetical protein